MRKYGRLDANQKEVVDELLKCGWSVQSLASIGGGCPDLIVGVIGHNFLLEVKDGSKPPSKRELTPDECAWRSKWRGPYRVVYSPGDAVNAVNLLICAAEGIDMPESPDEP